MIDEQHRFGVHQRLALQAKGSGSGAELLVMTATPIPRTLLLTSYGDMDVSRLDEKPPGRKPIVTRTVPLERLDEVVDGVGRAVDGGAQVYWVCPLVAESETARRGRGRGALSRRLRAALRRQGRPGAWPAGGRREGRGHGAPSPPATSPILVSTTVIEVGVDVPNATIMVIEHAERFGLAQLHQLRGRVGRGAAASSCILLYRQPLGETARARLEMMRDTEDGFVIAEEDLRLRGGGEVLGTRQSGLPAFRMADFPMDEELLRPRATRRGSCSARDPELEGHARRGAAAPALSVRARRRGQLIRAG